MSRVKKTVDKSSMRRILQYKGCYENNHIVLPFTKEGTYEDQKSCQKDHRSLQVQEALLGITK